MKNNLEAAAAEVPALIQQLQSLDEDIVVRVKTGEKLQLITLIQTILANNPLQIKFLPPPAIETILALAGHGILSILNKDFDVDILPAAIIESDFPLLESSKDIEWVEPAEEIAPEQKTCYHNFDYETELCVYCRITRADAMKLGHQ